MARFAFLQGRLKIGEFTPAKPVLNEIGGNSVETFLSWGKENVKKGVAGVAEQPSMTEQNQALEQQLTTDNRAYWDELVRALRQDPRLQDEELFQQYLNVQLTGLVAAQQQNQSAAEHYGGNPVKAANRLLKAAAPHEDRHRPWWLTADLWFPLGLFVVALILPTVILPAVPLQLLLVGVQLLLLVVAVALGIWVTPRVGARGRAIAWGVIAVVLIIALNLVAKVLPAAGLVYITRKGGSIALLLFAVIVTALIIWEQHRHEDSWLPALIADLWIMTVLALLARINPTAGLMATTTGTLLIGLGTLVGDISILISGWHIWRQRQAVQMSKK